MRGTRTTRPRRNAQVLDGRSLAEMHRPQYMEDDWSAGQCLGWRALRVGNRVYHSHGGGIHGFGTQVLFNLPAKVGVILFINMWPPPGGLDCFASGFLPATHQASVLAPRDPAMG